MACLAVLTGLLLFFLTPAPLWSETLPLPLVYTLGDAVLFKAEGPPRKLGHGRQPALAAGARQAVWVEHGDNPARAQLTLGDIGSGKTVVLARPGGYLAFPRFSPDGMTVLFVRRATAGASELWSVRPGQAPQRLAQAGGQAGDDFFEPVFSPAEGRILYHDLTFLYLMGPDGSESARTPLADFSRERKGVFTSTDRFVRRPDSTALAFSMSVEGSPLFRKKVPDLSSALFLYEPQSRKVTRLTPENITAFAPAWTPDGDALVFTGYDDKQAGSAWPFRIWMVRPGQTPVDMGPGADPMPASGP